MATAQAVYALAMLLERGTLYTPAIAPGLWRQIGLELSAQAEATLAATFGTAVPARVHLLAGVISVLGQPLGVAQEGLVIGELAGFNIDGDGELAAHPPAMELGVDPGMRVLRPLGAEPAPVSYTHLTLPTKA